ncbi:MAG: DNA polymerase III subunit gamma/tau [Gammaproteobacteria bacterium]|nr:DNA polymerase III subunit gamma/tau [Gammaproteobacteria bacterium]
MSYQVLARKWRPRNFSEMVGQEHVLRALINALDTNRVHHAFLFTGTRGVGKTTIARILAKSLNCEQGVSSTPCGECSACREIDEGRFVDLIEVDAASRTKVEDTRDLLDNVQYAPTRGRYKVYLIDEVHMLSNHSFNALLKTLEEPPPHVKFLLATTDPQKLPVTILSRCLQFNLRRLSQDLIQGHLQHLVNEEGLEAEPIALHQLARAADGSMRDALSLLDQAVAFGGGKLSDSDIRSMLGSIEQTYVYELLQALAASDGAAVLQQVQQLATQVPDFGDVLSEIITALHHIAILQQVPVAYDEAMGDLQRLTQLAEQLSAEDVQLYYQIGLVGRRDLNLAPDPRTGLEMVLLRMLAFCPANADGKPQQAQKKTVKPPESVVIKQEIREPDSTPVVEISEQNDGSQLTSIAVSHDMDWADMVANLQLVGVLNQLAMHCVIKAQQGNEIALALEPANEYLYTRERQERLQELLSEALDEAIKLNIEIEKPQQTTPAKQQQQQLQARQEQAEQTIKSDVTVKNIIETFNATVDESSIEAVD